MLEKRLKTCDKIFEQNIFWKNRFQFHEDFLCNKLNQKSGRKSEHIFGKSEKFCIWQHTFDFPEWILYTPKLPKPVMRQVLQKEQKKLFKNVHNIFICIFTLFLEQSFWFSHHKNSFRRSSKWSFIFWNSSNHCGIILIIKVLRTFYTSLTERISLVSVLFQ